MSTKRTYKLELNSLPKIEELLQELYNETNRMVNEAQEQINKLSSSVALNQEPMDAKVKYAKAMNDFLATKEKALSKKLDIAKLMSEILKFNGNMKAVVQESDIDWDTFKDALETVDDKPNDEEKIIEYRVANK